VTLPYPTPTSTVVSRVMRGNRKVGTRPELRLRSAMHRLGLRYRIGLAVQAGHVRVRPDAVFTRAKVAVFLDGCYWHACNTHGTRPASNADYWVPKLANNVARDRRVDEALAAAGWTVVRVWEHESAIAAADRVAALVVRAKLGAWARPRL
jgi:DNA mismatch endonuclease, patch repair protein